MSLRDWWARLAESGWGFPAWPREWFGRGLSRADAKAVEHARGGVGAFSPPTGIATMMVAPTLMEVGSPAQQERYIGAIARGEDVWCQLFSEPGAGSDLAGVQARAVRDGDEWVVNGRGHRRDPAQHRRRAGAGPAPRAPRRQGRALQRAAPGHRALTLYLVARATRYRRRCPGRPQGPPTRGGRPVKIHVISDKCQGHNRCYAIAPELFDVDDYGYASELGDGEVPSGLEAKAELAAANCPEHAIEVTR
ncbi:MAG: hypothetical protein GEV08_08145 [Acidimicrobiia bacterium]|nr:hypothetical protein [Acidimicrobiia bacterium]